MSLLTLAGGRLLPVAASTFAHVAIAGTLLIAAGHGRASAATTSEPTPTEIDVERMVEVVPETVAPAQNVEGAHHFESHHHPYPVPESHDSTPHDPSLVHVAAAPNAPSTPAEASPVLATDTPAPAMRKFTVVLGNAPDAHGAASNTGTGSGVTAAPVVAEPIFHEAEVSSRAHLVSSVAASYPSMARAGELEADVPVEIVVDTSGAVVEARIVTKAGSGFDESALAAIRRYRFAPAVRDGHPVRVRMRWSVQFRLR